jgi:hypothetical protein
VQVETGWSLIVHFKSCRVQTKMVHVCVHLHVLLAKL